MAGESDRLLIEGDTCWRRASCRRAAVLTDGESYFAALRKALIAAERTVFIVGWDIDSRTALPQRSGEEDDGFPLQLRDLLTALVERRPHLRVHMLLWDFTVLYTFGRELLPMYSLAWTTPRQIRVELDDELPLGACHHQKIIVVDDSLAFCGGMDVSLGRWDTSEHLPEHPLRRDADGTPGRAVHDHQVMVDGETAAALGVLVRERWRRAACESPIPLLPTGDPWPAGHRADFRDVELGIARTMPPLNGSRGIREVERLYRRAIAAAERFIYLENQYLTAEPIADALIARLGEKDRLEVLVVGPETPHGWLEAKSMGAGRVRFMERLRQAGFADRVHLVHPVRRQDGREHAIFVHAKLACFDDRLLQIGSANLSNRSMGLDSECDLALEADDPRERAAIANLRNRLLAEHLGCSAETVAEALEQHDSPFQAVRSLDRGARGLRRTEDSAELDDEWSRTLRDLVDLERPLPQAEIVGDMFAADVHPDRPRGRLRRLAAAAGLLVAALVWYLAAPQTGSGDAQWLQETLGPLGRNPWVTVLIPGLFVVGSLLLIPVAGLIAGTAVVLDPGLALGCAAAGCALAAAAGFGTGAWLGRDTLRNLIGRRLNLVSRRLSRRGVLAMAVPYLISTVPFGLVNLVAGASRVRFVDFMAGSLLGMVPSMLLMTALGDRLRAFLLQPDLGALAGFAAVVLAWLATAVVLQKLVSRRTASPPG